MIDQTAHERAATTNRSGTPSPSERMGTLAREYPELASFTADATLLEIKVKHGLGGLQEVRELGRRRAVEGKTPRTEAAPSERGGSSTVPTARRF